jgi:hypothetical protein
MLLNSSSVLPSPSANLNPQSFPSYENMSDNKQFTLAAGNVPQDNAEASPPTLPQVDTQKRITFTVQEDNHM